MALTEIATTAVAILESFWQGRTSP